MYKIRAMCKSIYISVGRVRSGQVTSGSGRIFFVFHGSGRVQSSAGRVGSGPEKWTHGQLCAVQDNGGSGFVLIRITVVAKSISRG